LDAHNRDKVIGKQQEVVVVILTLKELYDDVIDSAKQYHALPRATNETISVGSFEANFWFPIKTKSSATIYRHVESI
jgi:hypothetical protein